MAGEEHTLGRGRRIAVWVLVVLATVIGVVSILTVFVERQLLDNGAWRSSSAKVIAEPQVQDALSVFLTNQLYSSVDVSAALEEKLPPNLKPLAPPLSAALRDRTPQAVKLILARPRIQNLF